MSEAEARTDPRWKQANADYVDGEREGETPDDVYIRRVKAATVMHNIAKEYAARWQAE